MYKITVDYSPNENDNAAVREGIVAFNERIIGERDKPLSIFLKNDLEKIVGGLQAWFDYESIWIDILWVTDDLRKKGYGKELLRTAENEAIKKGCIFSRVDTWSFQAEEFYLKCGYQRVGEIKNHWLSHSKIFFRKNLKTEKLLSNQKLIIDKKLVRSLVDNQFPQWKNLSIRPVSQSGWDNRTFHLGENMLVRMPSDTHYALQVTKEQHWLPILAPLLPLSIPSPIAMGIPQDEYPWHWSVYRYLLGESASTAHITDLNQFAKTLATFLNVFQKINTTNGPVAGLHSFYRGGLLSIYDAETRQAIGTLKDKIDQDIATEIWEEALKTTWQDLPVWVHGDLSSGNLLVQDGQLSAVIDFGQLAIGDPACDLAITWTFFKDKSREIFRKSLQLDSNTWARGRAWTLWKALITAAGITNPNDTEAKECWRIIHDVINDYKQEKR